MSKHTVTVLMSMEFCPQVERPELRGRLVRQYAEVSYFAPVQHSGGSYMSGSSFRVSETRGDHVFGGNTGNLVDGIINAIGGDPRVFKVSSVWCGGNSCSCGGGHMVQFREWQIPQTPARMKILEVFNGGAYPDQESRAGIEKWWTEFEKLKKDYEAQPHAEAKS